MEFVLAIVGILAIAQPIAQGVLTLVEVGETTDKSISWRAQGCPFHHFDGSVGYICKQFAVKPTPPKSDVKGSVNQSPVSYRPAF